MNMNGKPIDMKKILLERFVLFFILLIILVMSIVNGNFLSMRNIENIFVEFSVYGVVACAMTLAIICGEFDLSVSSVYAWSSILFVDMTNKVGVVWAIIITLLSGLLIGLINGMLVGKARIHAFVVTMGSMISVKGLALFYTNGIPVNTQNEFVYAMGSGRVLGIPNVVIIFFAILLVTAFLLKHSKLGRNTYATGGNYEVAKLAGINVVHNKIIIFVMLGFAAAVSGMMTAFRIAAGSAIYGADLCLSSVAAVVIGGTSLAGGSGGVFRTFSGVLFIGLLFNALTILGLSAYYQQVIKGTLVIAIVAIDAFMNRSGKA
jgi:ribose transport system permease protein